MNGTGPILFGAKGDDPHWRPFSNFYMKAPFWIDDVLWPSTEHYFQAMKAFIPGDVERIRQLEHPWEAKQEGRKIPLRPDWEDIKYRVMLVCCLAKFQQNPEMRELLLSTGERQIHENRHDPEWGGGPNFPKGKDLLGKALMHVRGVLVPVF